MQEVKFTNPLEEDDEPVANGARDAPEDVPVPFEMVRGGEESRIALAAFEGESVGIGRQGGSGYCLGKLLFAVQQLEIFFVWVLTCGPLHFGDHRSLKQDPVSELVDKVGAVGASIGLGHSKSTADTGSRATVMDSPHVKYLKLIKGEDYIPSRTMINWLLARESAHQQQVIPEMNVHAMNRDPEEVLVRESHGLMRAFLEHRKAIQDTM